MDELLDLATASVRKAFDACRQSQSDSQLIGFAICSDDTAITFSPTAASADAAANFAHGSADEFRFNPENWDVQHGLEHVNEISDKIYTIYEESEDYENNPEWHEQHRTRVYDLMVAVLARLEDEGYFGVGAQRDQLFVIAWVVDSAVPQERAAGWSEKLNPPAVHSRFLKWLSSTHYWGAPDKKTARKKTPKKKTPKKKN